MCGVFFYWSCADDKSRGSTCGTLSRLVADTDEVTEDDRRPNAFSPAADFRTQTPWFRQMRTGRGNYVAADLQLEACDGARWWSCHTLHAWPLSCYHCHTVSMFVSEGVQRQNICRWFFIKWSDSQAPSSSSGWIFLNVFFSHKMGTLWHSLPNDSFSCVHLLQGDRLFITYRASWENYGENFLDRQGKMQLINSACND